VPDLKATPTATKTVGATTYSVQSGILESDTLTVRLNAQTAPADQNRNLLNNIFTTLRVRDAQGREISPGGSSIGVNRGDFMFPLKSFNNDEKIPGPYSLDWPIFTEFKSFDVPFELRDVVVP